MRRADDAAVRREPRQDQGSSSQIMQQDLERGLKEGRVHRLEHEIILVIRPDGLDEWSTRTMRFKAAAHQAFGVGTSLAEIVIDVNGRDAGAPAAVLELGQPCRHWQRVFQDLVAIREFEMIDYVDQDESDG